RVHADAIAVALRPARRRTDEVHALERLDHGAHRSQLLALIALQRHERLQRLARVVARKPPRHAGCVTRDPTIAHAQFILKRSGAAARSRLPRLEREQAGTREQGGTNDANARTAPKLKARR